MIKFLIIFLFTIVFFLPAIPGFCGESRTVTFQLSLTIPPHVMWSPAGDLQGTSRSNQIVQTDTMIRNNRMVEMTSVLVP
ncbi:MAG: hypothetical protein HQL13_05160 [Candidatus Omnitrophica bacterium]|nr:hypothetical protein [Candidatus Omnitrophota bacterium]